MANLDKTNTNRLLKLIRNITSDQQLPRTGTELWAKIGVEFLYKSQIFCTACMARCQNFGHRCSCNPSPRLIHSELILFPLDEELRRVVRMNIDLIDRYRPHNSADVIDGEFSLAETRKPC
jgi:hypothetical protein